MANASNCDTSWSEMLYMPLITPRCLFFNIEIVPHRFRAHENMPSRFFIFPSHCETVII